MAKPMKTDEAAGDLEIAAESGTVRYTLHLQPRHAQWVEQSAQRLGEDPLRFLETLVRRAYAADPARVVSTMPSGPGGAAGSAPRG